jgi:hypothetical protein
LVYEDARRAPKGTETTSTVRERRRHRRFLDEVRIRYRDLEGHDPSRWGLTRDLSLGGLCLLSEGPVGLGCHLAIEIHIEHETAPILALARVVRAERDEIGCTAGLEFLWVGEEDRGNLQRLAEYFVKKYGETGDYAAEP